MAGAGVASPLAHAVSKKGASSCIAPCIELSGVIERIKREMVDPSAAYENQSQELP